MQILKTIENYIFGYDVFILQAIVLCMVSICWYPLASYKYINQLCKLSDLDIEIKQKINFIQILIENVLKTVTLS